VLNLLQVTSGQQVMLRVRVGEIQRTALKQLGVEWSNFGSPDNFFYQLGIGSGIERFLAGSRSAFEVQKPLTDRIYSRFGWTNGGTTIDALVKALERDGLFKLLAEPNLVAISGEEAEFLAGGEVPIPVPQLSGGSSNSITIEYKPFGVAVRFRPFVLSENRIRMQVEPEVSELDNSIAVTLNEFSIPGLTTRRAKTTIELAPGESFMIAGLIKDQTRSSIDNVPGVKELPVLGALFRSTQFQRNETELVIAVTPYVVDPVKSTDVKLPTDHFVPASQMEMLFYGALGSMTGDARRLSQTPSVEGPIGFMVD
jgi:pilus assembly protein CpaC